MATQIQPHETPAWVEHMRERGFVVREARPGFVFQPIENRPREAGPMRVFWRKVKRVLGKRALP
jgi:hypothetical protein